MAGCPPQNTRTRCAASRRLSRSIRIALCTTSSSAARMPKWAEMRTRGSLSPGGSRWLRRRRMIRKPRTSHGRFSGSCGDGLRQFRQFRINVEVVPKLSRHHGGETALDGEPRQPSRHLAKSTPPVMHRGRVEIARAAQGFFAQELADELRLGIHMETVQRRAEDYFAA